MFHTLRRKFSSLSSTQRVFVFYTSFTIGYFLFRCIALDTLYMAHDERDIVFSAWSLAKSGKDLFGNVFPMSFEEISPDNPLISIWFSAIFWLMIPVKNVFFARLPFVLISSSIPLVLFLLVNKVTRATAFAITVSLIAGVSPWMFHLGRMAMDVTLAFPTVLIAIILLLSRKRVIAYILFTLAFYNYQGFRTVIPFIPFIVEWYLQKTENKHALKPYMIHVFFILLLFFSVFLIDSKVTTRRSDQVLFLNMERFAADVDLKRRETIFPLFASKIFDSKLTESIRYGYDTLTQGLSTHTFFFKGDASPINGTGVGGLLFISTLPFLLFGIMSLHRHTLSYRFLASFILWGMIPSLASLNGHSYAIRGVLMMVGFATLIALGISEAWILTNNHSVRRKVFLCITTLALVVDISTFTYEYFGRRPITLSEVFNERERAVSEHIGSLNSEFPVVVYDTDISTKNTFMTYAFLKMDEVTQIQTAMKRSAQEYRADNLIFRRCEETVNHPQNTIAIISNHCLNDLEYGKLKDMKLKEIVYRDTPILVAYFVLPAGKTFQ